MALLRATLTKEGFTQYSWQIQNKFKFKEVGMDKRFHYKENK